MKHKICFPNYKRSILNISNSILNYYNIPKFHDGIYELDFILKEKNYKNIVFILFDAMGSKIIDGNLKKDSFIVKNKITDLTSVFPSTTAAAYTSINSGLSPLEHGWLGWHCYFHEYGHSIELFKNRDFYTKENLPIPSIADIVLPYNKIIDIIKTKNKNGIKTHEIMPEFNRGTEVLVDIFSKIKEICKNGDKNYIHVYWDNPDTTIHKTGCVSEEVSHILNEINNYLEKISSTVDDTLFIVTADHGQIDTGEYIFIDEIKELKDCIEFPPSIHERAMNFMLKKGKTDYFIESFLKILGSNDFMLVKKEEYIKNFLGNGIVHTKVNDFVGDCVAISTGDKIPIYRNSKNDKITLRKAYHSGLTEEEMIVPLIVFKSGL